MGLNHDSFQKSSFDPNAFDFGSDRVVSAVTSQITLTPKAAEIKFNPVFRSRPQRNIVPHKPTISVIINLGD